ncbi:MAG: biopolymer transporter ExbD [Kiritimatiellae bacterium]|jgi:biopolymer transport protein ExbD|nr:biopolymer transporter ExbD [Kiritimatiellia bacterium]
MPRRHKAGYKPQAEMNLTPLMDLTFILLITFIITFPLIENGIPIKLPQGKTKPVDASEASTAVTVDKDGRYYVGDLTVTLDELRSELEKRKASNPEIRVIIRGDVAAQYGAVAEVAKLLSSLGIKNTSLSFQE